jgi:hypothetical protein
MKVKLIRTKDSYHLWLNPEIKEQEHIASINPILNDNGFDLRKHKLSKQNCDEIFWGLYDTEIEVEIDMDILNEYNQPKLDSEGCLVLTKKI